MEKQIKLIAILSKYLASYYSEKSLSDKTKLNYQIRFNSIVSYIGTSGILISEVDYSFIEGLRRHFNKMGYDITHTSRNIELIKNAMDYAVLMKLIPNNPIAPIKSQRSKPKEIVHLQVNELKALINYQGKHQLSKDLYILQSFTGLSYGDLWSFKVITNETGDWITGKRCKTKKEYWIPLEAEAKQIIDKYKVIPKIKNCDYNIQIKLIALVLNIDKHLTTHTGRKTFATLMYEDGWSAESIKDMMGIDIKILLTHYVKKSRHRIENELILRQAH
jgi:site-specific recombinase XerD